MQVKPVTVPEKMIQLSEEPSPIVFTISFFSNFNLTDIITNQPFEYLPLDFFLQIATKHA